MNRSIVAAALALLSLLPAAVTARTVMPGGADPVKDILNSHEDQSFAEDFSRTPGPAPDDAVVYLRNGDFETTGSFTPEAWDLFRVAYADNDAKLARSGVWSVRSSAFAGWSQDLQLPVSPFQTYATAGFALREFEDERPGARSVFFDSGGIFVDENNSYSPVDAPAGSYGEFWASQDVPEGAAFLTLYLLGQNNASWIRFDDLALVTEQFHFANDMTGEEWQLTNGASTTGDSLTLPGGSSAAQRVATALESKEYFVWGRYTASAEAQLTVSETWLARDATEPEVTTSTTHQLLQSGGTFLSDPGRIAGEASGQSEVKLVVESAGEVNVSSLRRGFAQVEPKVLTAGPASPDSPLQLTAAWPGYLTTATIEILAGTGEVLFTPAAVMHGTSVRAQWEPGDTPSGDYIARFTLLTDDAEAVEVDREFTIIREDDATSDIPAFHWPEYVRGAWLFTFRDLNTSDTIKAFELASQDGFNFAIVLCRLDQLTTVRQAAEMYGLPFVIMSSEPNATLKDYEERTWFSKAHWISVMEEIFLPVVDSPMFQGVYVTDEPAKPITLDLVRRTFLSIVQNGTLGTPITVFLRTTTAESINDIRPPVGLVDLYPYDLQFNGDSTAGILKAIVTENFYAKTFAAIGRDLWMVTQGMTSRNSQHYYEVPPSMHSAQLQAAVMAGARGTIPFQYTTDISREGLRTRELQPTPKLEPHVRFNAQMERLGPVLMQLDIPELRNDAPYPFAVSVAAGPSNESYVYVMNADDVTTRTLFVDLVSAPVVAPFDLVTEQPVTQNSSGSLVVNLEPGGWAIFSIGENSIAGLSTEVVEPPVISSLELPITHLFTATSFGDVPRAVSGLEFSDDGNTLAASLPRLFLPPSPPFFNLLPGGGVEREDGVIDFIYERSGIVATGDYYAANSLIGIRYFTPGGFESGPVSAYEGHSGGAVDAIRTPDSNWISMGGFGVRQLEETTAGLVSAHEGRANFGDYLDMFGPFADGSVTVIVNYAGVHNIKPGQVQENRHVREPLRYASRNADLNASRLLAVPRHHHGVGVFQLEQTGEPHLLYIFGSEALDADAVAWVDETTLAVADGATTVRFYRVDGAGAQMLGSWRPLILGSYMISMASENGRLAIGFQDGRVVVADATEVQQPTSAIDDWMLFGH